MLYPMQNNFLIINLLKEFGKLRLYKCALEDHGSGAGAALRKGKKIFDFVICGELLDFWRNNLEERG